MLHILVDGYVNKYPHRMLTTEKLTRVPSTVQKVVNINIHVPHFNQLSFKMDLLHLMMMLINLKWEVINHSHQNIASGI